MALLLKLTILPNRAGALKIFALCTPSKHWWIRKKGVEEISIYKFCRTLVKLTLASLFWYKERLDCQSFYHFQFAYESAFVSCVLTSFVCLWKKSSSPMSISIKSYPPVTFSKISRRILPIGFEKINRFVNWSLLHILLLLSDNPPTDNPPNWYKRQSADNCQIFRYNSFFWNGGSMLQ
jgi:hypothetical protein